MGSMQSWHDRPIRTQSVENWAISVQSEIKPNLTAVRQVWAQTGGQAQAVARGSSAILSVPRNPQNELFSIVAILPQSRPRYLQSRRLQLDSEFWAILMQFRRIALRLDRNCVRLLPWIAIRGVRLEPWPRGSSAILSMPLNPRNWVLRLFAILLQSCELWVDCRIKAILTQFR